MGKDCFPSYYFSGLPTPLDVSSVFITVEILPFLLLYYSRKRLVCHSFSPPLQLLLQLSRMQNWSDIHVQTWNVDLFINNQ